MDAVLLLLEHKVNVTMLDPITKMTMLQLLLKDLRVRENHRLIVDKLLEKGNIVFFTFRSGQWDFLIFKQSTKQRWAALILFQSAKH